MGLASFSSSFLQWLQGSFLLSIVWLQSFLRLTARPAPNWAIRRCLYTDCACGPTPHAQSALNASFILAIYNLFFEVMGFIIPPRPAATLMRFWRGITEIAWLSTLNSYSGMTPPTCARVSPSYYHADPPTQTNGRKVICQNRLTFIKTRSNQGCCFGEGYLDFQTTKVMKSFLCKLFEQLFV